jgi:2-polyprenyl-3-methyl-5-hydroxy-6-metoxy-1,4-benzoquinol methylase
MSDHEYAYNDFDENPDPPHQPLYLDKVVSYLSKAGSRTVLDAGCGDGNFTQSVAERGFDVYGIDMSESGIRRAQERPAGTFVRASLYEPLTEAVPGVSAFDAVMAVEVVEHLYAPRIFVQNAYDALRPGGLLVITTPYWGYLKNLALAVTNRTDAVLSALWDGGHIKHWSRKTMTTLLEEKGFEIVGFEGCGRAPYLWRGMINVGRKPG